MFSLDTNSGFLEVVVAVGEEDFSERGVLGAKNPVVVYGLLVYELENVFTLIVVVGVVLARIFGSVLGHSDDVEFLRQAADDIVLYGSRSTPHPGRIVEDIELHVAILPVGVIFEDDVGSHIIISVVYPDDWGSFLVRFIRDKFNIHFRFPTLGDIHGGGIVSLIVPLHIEGGEGFFAFGGDVV